MKFARVVFLLAGIYGVLALLPLYFLEGVYGTRFPPAVNHPELYYGFAGVALAWQILFLTIWRDPARYRAIIPAAIFEKLAYGAGVFALYTQGRVPASLLGSAVVDLVWAALFIAAYAKLR